MVNMYEAKIGDYVMFRNKGYGKIIEIIAEQEDHDDFNDAETTHRLTFEGIDCPETFGHDGAYCPWEHSTTNLLDITDVIPALIVERELQKKAAEEIIDECPF